MPRPKTLSDEDVMKAALDVLADQGVNFTLSNLARRVGLSRAALIQRFGNREAILRLLAQFEVETTQKWLSSFPAECGKGALWTFLEQIVRSMGDGDGFSARVQIAALEVQDPALKALANQRYQLVQQAIADRLPDGFSQLATAQHLHAVIAGSTMQWVVSPTSDSLSDFVLGRLRWAFERLDLT